MLPIGTGRGGREAHGLCDQSVENQDYDDSHYNEYPVGNFGACY